MWGNIQFTSEEVAASRKVSIACIHVERSIGYLKRYKILGNKVVAKMLPYLSDIAFVCAQLVNLNPVFLREVDTDFLNDQVYLNLSKMLNHSTVDRFDIFLKIS